MATLGGTQEPYIGRKRTPGSTRRLSQVEELEQNLAALRPWNSEFEIPDVVAFADFVHCHRVVAESRFASQKVFVWDRALRFPYPNGSKLRELVVLDAPSGLRKWEGVTNEADLWKMYRAEPNLLYGTRTCAPDSRAMMADLISPCRSMATS